MSSAFARRLPASSSRCWACAGTFASLGAQGPAVQEGMGKHLGMPPVRVPSHTLGDRLAENICLFGLIAATCRKIAREVYTLMKTEFGEVEEPELLAADLRVTAHLDQKAIAALLDPTAYTSLCAEMARDAAAEISGRRTSAP